MSSQKAPREPPSKFVSANVEVQLACRLLFVDLEGLNDGRAVKTIIPQVNPRKMVLDFLDRICGPMTDFVTYRLLFMRRQAPQTIFLKVVLAFAR